MKYEYLVEAGMNVIGEPMAHGVYRFTRDRKIRSFKDLDEMEEAIREENGYSEDVDVFIKSYTYVGNKGK